MFTELFYHYPSTQANYQQIKLKPILEHNACSVWLFSDQGLLPCSYQQPLPKAFYDCKDSENRVKYKEKNNFSL